MLLFTPSPLPSTVSPKPLPIHRTLQTSSATCLYDFEGSNDGELPCTAGETVSVTEPDNEGTGWIRVANAAGGEGYVPTAYMQCS